MKTVTVRREHSENTEKPETQLMSMLGRYNLPVTADSSAALTMVVVV